MHRGVSQLDCGIEGWMKTPRPVNSDVRGRLDHFVKTFDETCT